MTWQGGKLGREGSETLPFARLRALAGQQDDAAKSLEQLSTALSGLGKPVRLHIRLVSGADGETVDHWEVRLEAREGHKGQTEGCGCGGGDASGDVGADRARAAFTV